MRYVLIAAAALAACGALLWFRPPSAARPASAVPDGWSAVVPSVRPSGRGRGAQTLVYVAGQVVHPGVYSVSPDARVRDAVTLAGGLRPGADPVAVNLAAHVRDGDEIVVPESGAAGPHSSTRHGPRATGRHRRGTKGRTRPEPPSAPIDLNAADAATLATIPGIGPGLAERIVAFRAANGRFDAPDELLDVQGITDRRLDAMLPYLTVR